MEHKSPSESSTHGEPASLPVPSALEQGDVASLIKTAFIPMSELPGQSSVLAEAPWWLSLTQFQTPGKEKEKALA